MESFVSIIMATYNREHLIAETLDSIIAQRYEQWECIIIDDGSTDNVASVVGDYIDKDKRFSYQKRAEKYQKGLPGCRNQGLDLAKGDFIVFFDDDDIVHPDNLFCCVQALKNQKYDFCRYERDVFFGDFDVTFDRGLNYGSFEITEKDLYKVLRGKIPFNSCAVVWKSSCIGDYRFREDLMYAEEWELYNRMISDGITGISIDKVLFYGRKHSKSNTGEFSQGDSIRVASKAAAAMYLISHFDTLKILDKEIGMYMFSIMHLTKNKDVGRCVLKAKNINFKDRLYLNLRYYLLPATIALGRVLRK